MHTILAPSCYELTQKGFLKAKIQRDKKEKWSVLEAGKQTCEQEVSCLGGMCHRIQEGLEEVGEAVQYPLHPSPGFRTARLPYPVAENHCLLL